MRTMASLKLEIEDYAILKDGWDGIGSKAPSRIAIDGILFALDVLPDGVELPTTMLYCDGEVGLYWHVNNFYADLCFDTDGIGSFFSRNGSAEYFKDNLTTKAMIPSWFKDILPSRV